MVKRFSRTSILQAVSWFFLTYSILLLGSYLVFQLTPLLPFLDKAYKNGFGIVDLCLVFLTIGVILLISGKIWGEFTDFLAEPEFTAVDGLILTSLFISITWVSNCFSIFRLDLPLILQTAFGIIIALASGTIIARLPHFFSRPNQTNPDGQPSIFPDNPIRLVNEDQFYREGILKNIATVLETNSRENPLRIGITGSWGSGKTSILNLLDQRLSSEQYIKVRFSPWFVSVGHVESSELILNRFFKELENAISQEIFAPDLKRTLGKYFKALSPLVKNSPVSLDFLSGFFETDLLETKESINHKLLRLKKKVVVLIDDLDRMDSKEISYTFKLIRLCLDFENVDYLLFFDRDYVTLQLKKEFGQDASKYLEKIIQVEFALPELDPAKLFDDIENHLTSIGNAINYDFKLPEFHDRLLFIHDILCEWLNTPRAIKVFLNRYWLALNLLKGEVDYFDLLGIQLIAYRDIELYRNIYKNSKFFIGSPGTNNERINEMKHYVDEALAAKSNHEKNQTITLLALLFPLLRDTSQPNKKSFPSTSYKSLTNTTFFPKYFIFDVQKGQIPEAVWLPIFEKIDGKESAAQAIKESLEVFRSYGVASDWCYTLLDTFRYSNVNVSDYDFIIYGVCSIENEIISPSDDDPQRLSPYSNLLSYLIKQTRGDLNPEIVKRINSIHILNYLRKLLDHPDLLKGFNLSGFYKLLDEEILERLFQYSRNDYNSDKLNIYPSFLKMIENYSNQKSKIKELSLLWFKKYPEAANRAIFKEFCTEINDGISIFYYQRFLIFFDRQAILHEIENSSFDNLKLILQEDTKPQDLENGILRVDFSRKAIIKYKPNDG